MKCPACDAELAEGMRFCGYCGAALEIVGDQPSERRLLTVMFCDLVGSTSMSEARDPEEFKELVQEYNEACVRIVEGLDGFVADYRGDAVLAYFGYPRALDDDVDRAIRAGLEIVKTMPTIRMRARVGIHTGLVIVGEVGAGRYRKPDVVIGETPNIAARLQDLAGDNEVVISEYSERFTKGRFALISMGAPTLKGIARPISVFRVLGEAEPVDVPIGNATPFVDRGIEMATLEEHWMAVAEGSGTSVIVTGEPGVGKSRFLEAFTERLGDDYAFERWSMSPEHQHSPMRPVIEHALASGEFDRVAWDAPDDHQLIAELIGKPHRDVELTPLERRQRTIAALVAWLESRTTDRPLVLTVDDLHWADHSTAELLGSLVDVVGRMPLLLLCTARTMPDWPWARASRVAHVALQRLPDDAATTIVMSLGALSNELVEEVVARAEGVPLFVEELTKAIQETGLSEPGIPVSLHHSLTVRLDRLGTARDIAQVASVIGRDFDLDLLTAVADAEPAFVESALESLVASGLVQLVETPDERRAFRFKHALVRDTAYESMLRTRRRELHGRVADAMSALTPDVLRTRPEVVAQHFAQAERIDLGVAHWTRAAQLASDRHALVEAIEHAQAAIGASRSLPPSRDRDTGELLLLYLLRQLITNANGPGDPTMEALHVRGMELATPGSAEHFGMLCGLVGFHSARAEHERAFDAGLEAIDIADTSGRRVQKMWARVLQGTTLMRFGDLGSSTAMLSDAFAAYRPDRDGGLAQLAGMDPAFQAAWQMAMARRLQGEADDADTWLQLALRTASGIDHPFTACQADMAIAAVSLLDGDGSRAREHSELALAVARAHGYVQLEGQTLARLGRALALLGSAAEGAARIEEGIGVIRGANALIESSWYLGWLAESRLEAGDVRGAESAATDALAFVESTRERLFESMILRVLGDIARRHGDDQGAERFYRRAAVVGRAQGAVLLQRDAEERLSAT